MTYNEFKDAVVRYAAEAGLTDYDLYYSNTASTSVQAWEGEIDDFSDNASTGVCFRCVSGGKMGYSNTQQLSDDEARRLVKDAREGTEIIQLESASAIYAGGGEYAQVPQARETSCDVDRLKALALEMEKQILAKDDRITGINYAVAQFSFREVALYNSHGLDLVNRQSGYSMFGGAVADTGGRKYSGMGFHDCLTQAECDPGLVAEEAAALALGSIGASSVPSGSYPVVFNSRMAATLLSCFTSIFSADAAQKGLSLLAGKEGEQIAAPCLTLTDDPHYEASTGKSPFDDEGVATYPKAVIEKGVLKTMLYDLKSAAKAGQASTGNGRKGGYAADITVAPFTLRLEPGTQTQAQLLEQAGRGILITEMKGMHASASPVTGDFSLESKGHYFENGRIVRAAEQFTIAGNFFQLMKDITALGSDIQLSDDIAAPSILVSSLVVAGE